MHKRYNTDKEKGIFDFENLMLILARNTMRLFPSFHLLPVLSVFICVHLCFPLFLVRRDAEAVGRQEIWPKAACWFCAAKRRGIIVATVDTHSEPGSRQPVVVALSALRAGVLLGAVEWIQPESRDKPIRLDSELARLAVAFNTSGPTTVNGATDIESIGVALLERVRDVAGQLHQKINIGEDEPLIRLVLVDYVPDYGPEAWAIDYHIPGFARQ